MWFLNAGYPFFFLVIRMFSACNMSDFGCCPDNITFATGPNLEGCSNCSSSEFGCCADNMTIAEGSNKFGCPEYEETSGEEVEKTAEEKE